MNAAPLEASAALVACERLAGVAVLIASLELLARPRFLERGGLLAWEVSRLRSAWLSHGRVARGLDLVFAGPALRALLAVRALAAAWLIFGPAEAGRAAAVMVAAGTSLLLLVRNNFGNDGADQMSFLVLAAAALARLGGAGREGVAAALLFVALQACLSYATAGIAKLAGRSWRDGSGLIGVVSTHTYGLPALAAGLRRHPGLALGASWLVIVGESLFPLVLVAPNGWIPAFLALGLVFHLGCAVVMGLNTFVWSFAASYPAIYWVATTF